MSFKKYFPFITCLVFLACHNSSQSPVLIIDSLRYTVYWWNPIDSGTYNIHIDHYIEIDKKGNALAFQRSIGGYDKFYKGQIDDSIKEKITQAFISQHYDSIYTITEGSYCGPSNLIDYVLNGKRHTIKFPNGNAPEKILLLGNILDSFISVKANYQTTAFDLTPYKNELMRIDTARRTLPKVEKVNVEFQTQ